jgi:pimeloyl-ACP methyl ester carboxylesterase
MLAAELAAAYPGQFSRLALIAPLGLWRDDTPVSNWMTVPSGQLSAMFFARPDSYAARAMFATPADREAAISAGVGLVWALGCTGKFIWPLPEKGLVKRLHRVSAPTLIVWGELDRLVPSSYAGEFADRIPGSRVVMIPEAGHTPQLERLDATYAAVASFLR